MSRPLVIIEAPYAQDPPRMVRYLGRCVQDTVLRGEAAMASVPIYAMTGALDDLNPQERQDGIAAGLEWYRVAERCVCYVDHGVSKGMRQGIEAASAHRVAIEFREIGPEPETSR